MPPFERSEDHEILHALLAVVPPGVLVSYQQMKEATGKPISGGTAVLQSVLHRLLREDGIVFENDRGRGYHRLTAAETVDASERDRSRLHQHARRNGTRLSTVDTEFATLDPTRRLRYATTMSLVQAIAAATTKNAIKLLERQVRKTDMRPLPFLQTLAAFLQKEE